MQAFRQPTILALAAGMAIYLGLHSSQILAQEEHQYSFGDISVPAATADEPVRKELSVEKAVEYLELGATAWTKERKFVSCHTNGAYLVTRPALIEVLGKPSVEMREFFVAELKQMQQQDIEKLKGGIRPTQIAYIASGLAEWDAHVNKKLTAETAEALALLSKIQADDGSYGNANCWPP